MATQIHHHHLHFLIVPLMSQSHLIPMIEFAKLLAAHRRGLTVTIIITPLNAARFRPLIDRATASGLDIRLIPLHFPCSEVGLPENIENLDSLTSPDHLTLFFTATALLQQPLEKLISELNPPPSCLITSNYLPWTSEIATRFGIPRYVLHPISCFHLLCSHRIEREVVDMDSESILVPDVPHRVEFKKSQVSQHARKNSYAAKAKGLMDRMKVAQASARGTLVNSFEELEMEYVEGYKKVAGNNTWCIGPVTLSNKEASDKFDRGYKADIDEHYCLKWLDSKSSNSVIYVCFGSLCHISCSQLIEIGLGLESSNSPFVWIIRGSDKSAELEKWLETERFEERNKEKGLVIKGWAPQVMILTHPAVGGFLTHCGWNSTLEAVGAGVPMVTWPMFADHFYNDKLIIDVLRIGVRIGVEGVMQWGIEEVGDVKRDQVKAAVEELMRDGEEGGERRSRARKLAEMAKKTLEEGGSSYMNMTLFIQDVTQLANQSHGLKLETLA